MSRILITGCSTGFGRATAIEAARRGHAVVATARNVDTIRDLDVAAHLELDVTDPASIDAAITEAGHLDALVNNAGIARQGPIESYPINEAEAVFATNTFGPLRMIQAVAPAMRESGSGLIVNISSVEGFVTSPLGGIYSASKHALESISEAAHYELGHFGVRIVLIEPGYFATAMQTKPSPIPIDGTPYEELRRQRQGMDAKVLGGERPGPEVVAKAVVDLIESDDNPMRIPVGADAEMIAKVRHESDDATFEATMRSVIGLTW